MKYTSISKPHARPSLSAYEHSHNTNYLEKLQALLESKGFKLSETMKQRLINKAKTSGIWFQGLSPLVFNEFIRCLTLALANKELTDERRIEVIFKELNRCLDEENISLRNSLRENSSRVLRDEQTGVVDHLIDHVKKGSVPSGYWLKSADMVALTEVVSKIQGFHVVMPTDVKGADRAHATARQLILQGAKAVYVPVEQNEHWVLTIYGPNHFQEFYNPPGNGKCGDHVVAKILGDAQARSGQSLYPEGVTENSSASQVRQASIALISSIHDLDNASVSSTSSPTENKFSFISNNTGTAAERFKASAARSKGQTKLYRAIPRNEFKSELERMSNDLNARATKLIDSISKCSSEVQKAEWKKFDQNEWHKVEQVAQKQTASSLGFGHLFKKETPTPSTSCSAEAAGKVATEVSAESSQSVLRV